MIDITNVVNISVSAPPAGLAPYNVNNLLCITQDTPIVSIGSDQYRVYTNPTDVGTDWGTTSEAYKAAIAVFSQSPNILTGNGVFLVAPSQIASQTVTITPNVTLQSEQHYILTLNSVAYDFTSDATPTAAEVVTGLKALIAGVTSVVATGTDTLILTSTSHGFTHSESANLSAGSDTIVMETLDDAITRIKALVFFGGVSYAYAATDNEIIDAAAVCQAARKLFFVSSSTESDLSAAGLLYILQGSSSTYSRLLYYSVVADENEYRWAYAGRAMSTNFSGSNTTQTMHLKQLSGVVADPGINATVLAKARTIGADVYVDIAGRATLMTYGANEFYDDVYNLLWFVSAMEVAGFNALATTSTKLPQTEQGMDYLKSAYRSVCNQAVNNRFVGPGAWASPDTFGVQEDFIRNIGDVGYYIYSLPVNLQPQAERELRQAPVVSVAIKYQGAIHSSSVIINVNA